MVEGLINRGSKKSSTPAWATIPFLRRGARFDLERFHIEKMIGRRGDDDWLTAGSAEWLLRREEEDKLKIEAIDEAARAELCMLDPDVMEWNSPSGKRFVWPCGFCDDGILNGDEADVDCGGSCFACAVPPEPEPEPWDPSVDDTDGGASDENELPEQENGTAFFMEASYNSQTNAAPPAGYAAGAGNPYFPWTMGSILYNNSNWRDWYPYHTSYG